jgi:hypothetical protein
MSCLVVWCGALLLLSFRGRDWPLVCLLVIAIAVVFISPEGQPTMDTLALFFGVMFGKAVSVFLRLRWIPMCKGRIVFPKSQRKNQRPTGM